MTERYPQPRVTATDPPAMTDGDGNDCVLAWDVADSARIKAVSWIATNTGAGTRTSRRIPTHERE